LQLEFARVSKDCEALPRDVKGWFSVNLSALYSNNSLPQLYQTFILDISGNGTILMNYPAASGWEYNPKRFKDHHFDGGAV
jgi:hypothetical protein